MGDNAQEQEDRRANLIVPPAIEEALQSFEQANAPFTVRDVHQALAKTRKELQDLAEAEDFGAWAEILAFALLGSRTNASPWGTFFGPQGSGTDNDGKPFYFPDIASADANVIAHWANRARSMKHPVLAARYADLVWEMAPLIAGGRRDPEMARVAIEGYLASVPPAVFPDIYDRFDAALRALDLACLIRDQERKATARDLLMQLHRDAVEARKGFWWLAYDRLIHDKNADVTDEQKQELVKSIEELLLYFSDTSKPEQFNPHDVENAAKLLIPHYTRFRQYDDVRRLHAAVAKSFEHFAGLGDAMLASSVLQTAVNAYRDAGMPEDSKRARVLMQEKTRHARELMAPVITEFEISREDMDKFCATVVVDDLGSTFIRLALQFLPKR